VSPEALAEVLTQAAGFLRANQQFMTTDMLLRVMQLYEQAKGLKDVLAAGLQLTPAQADRLFASADKLLAFEQRLVTTDLTDNFVHALEGLRGRPMILRMLAALLR
jgi:hypothetical protein